MTVLFAVVNLSLDFLKLNNQLNNDDNHQPK